MLSHAICIIFSHDSISLGCNVIDARDFTYDLNQSNPLPQKTTSTDLMEGLLAKSGSMMRDDTIVLLEHIAGKRQEYLIHSRPLVISYDDFPIG